MFNDRFQKSISIVLFFTLISTLWFCTAANVVSAAEIEEKPKQGLFGDINGDGVIDYKDYVKLYRHVNCLPLGDINKDGIVDEEDYNLLYNYVKNPDKYPLSDEQKLCADMNEDGKINAFDYVKLYRYVNCLPLGDINKDGVVDEEDSNLIFSYMTGGTTLSDEQEMCADVNGDGSIDARDMQMISDIMKKKVNSTGYEDRADVNGDGEVDNFDVNILNDIINTLENL